jgi:ankyrin repeat protein
MSTLSIPFTNCCRTKNSEYPLTFERALKVGNIDKLRSIIAQDSFLPNKPLKNGAYPLHLAIYTEAPQQVIEELLKKGANPFLQDNSKLTAVDHALLVKDVKRFAQLVSKIVPLDEKAVLEVKKESPQIELLTLSAKNSLRKAIELVEINANALTETSRNLLKGKWNVETTSEELSKKDRYGMLPLHYAIQVYSSAPSEHKTPYADFIKVLIAQSEKLTSKTKSSLSLAHFAITAKCPEVLELLLGNGKAKKALLEMTTLTGLSPLHVAFLQEDHESVKILLKHAPELLTKPDQNGLTPLQMYVQSFLKNENSFAMKTGAIQEKELALLAMQCLLPLFAATSKAYLPANIATYASIAFLGVLYTTECAQTNELLPSTIQGALEACFAPSGYLGFLGKARRIGSVAKNSFNGLRASWHFSSYSPWTSLRNGIVHIGVAGLSGGRELTSWWNGSNHAPKSVWKGPSQCLSDYNQATQCSVWDA